MADNSTTLPFFDPNTGDKEKEDQVGYENIFLTLPYWQTLSGVAAFLALVVSMVHIARHLLYNRSRGIKECTLRMLVLVPLYSLDSFCCVMFPESTLLHILTAVRDFYEAVVLASFVQFLLVVLGGPGRGAATALAEKMLLHKPEHSFFPLCYLRRMKIPVGMFWAYRAGPDFISWVLIGILQYSIIMLFALFIRIALYPFLAYFELFGSDREKLVEIILLQVKACSAGWAMYNLLVLGVNLQTCSKTNHITKEVSLGVKFLAVKGIVFFTFLQQWGFKMFFLQVLEPHGDRMEQMSADSVRDLAQNALLCFETLLFAFWHWRAYTCDEFNNMAMRMQLNEAMRSVESSRGASDSKRAQSIPEWCHARRELERAISEAKDCLQHEFIVGLDEYLNAGPACLPNSSGGASPKLTPVNGDSLRTVVLRDFTAQHGQHLEPLRLVLQDEALRRAELVLADLPPLEEDAFFHAGSRVTVSETQEPLRWRRTWYILHNYMARFVRCCLCDFWFCLFWPEGTVGIFATFTLYDEIRSLRTKAQTYDSAVEVLPAVGEKKIRCIWCPRRCCKGNAEEEKREVTEEILNAAFQTFDTMAGEPGNGKLESQEKLEILADGLGSCVDLYPVFEGSHSPVEQAAFVKRLIDWHSEHSQPITRGALPSTAATPLLSI